MAEWRAVHVDGRAGGLGAVPPEIHYDAATGRLRMTLSALMIH